MSNYTENEITDMLDAAYQAGWSDGITDGLSQKEHTENHTNHTRARGTK